MKHSIFFCILFLAFVKISSAQVYEWTSSIGGINDDRSMGIASDSAGYTYVTGHFTGTANFGGTTLTSYGGEDIIIVKFSPLGNVEWAIQAGGTSNDRGYEMTTDKYGNIYLTGYFKSAGATFGTFVHTANYEDIFITKISPSGIFQWVSIISGNDCEKGFDIDVDSSGNVYVSGDIRTQAIFSATTTLTCYGDYDGFVAKYDNFGVFQWAKQFGGTGKDKSQGISVSPNGDIFVSGYFSGTSDFDGTTLISNGDFDACMIKLNTSGTLQWVKQGGGSLRNISNSVDVDNNGNSYWGGFITGNCTFDSATVSSNGGEDLFLAKYDVNGNLQWVKNYGSTGADRLNCINIDNDGILYCTGKFSNTCIVGIDTLTSYGSTDCLIGKFFNNGTPVWVSSVGGIGEDIGWSITSDYDGDVYLTGYYSDSAFFDQTILSATGGSDIFVTKITKVPSALQIIGLEELYCKNSEPDTIEGLPANGTFLGNGIINGIFYPSIAGSGYHVITYTTGSLSIYQDVFIPEMINPIQFDDTSFCQDDILALSFDTNYSYFWSNGYSGSNLEMTNSALLTVLIVDSFSCTNSDTINIICHPTPNLSLGCDTSILFGQSLIIDLGNNYEQYLWSDNSSNNCITISTQGQYSVTVTDINGCSASDTIYISVISDIHYQDPLDVLIYPNPSNNVTIINTNSSIEKIQIFDIHGKIINDQKITKFLSKNKIEIHNLKEGIYFVLLNFKNKKSYKAKIIKQ